MDVSQHVYNLCKGVWHDASFDVLKAYLEEHPEVKVDLYKDNDGFTALHMTSFQRSPKSAELLLDHKANINARANSGNTPLFESCYISGNEDTTLLLIERGANIHLKNQYGLGYRMDESKHVYSLCKGGWHDASFDVLKAYLEEHPEVKVDLYRDDNGRTALHMTSYRRSPKLAELLLDHKADINARTSYGDTCLTLAPHVSDNEDTALLLIERGADIHLRNKWNEDALRACVRHKIPSVAFILLCCGSDLEEDKNNYPYKVELNACIAEYKQTHAFIEAYHESLTHTLANEAKVDTRLARTSLGIYHEPLERVLEYLGLSMHKDQTVNTSIDGQGGEEGQEGGVMRVLIPNQARNAMHWYDLSKQ
jgi:hypothetical protein